VVAGVVVILVATWFVTTVRLPLLVVSPGAALPVGDQVEFPTQPEDELSGRLLLTTVRISTPNSLEALGAWLDRDKDVIRRTLVIPEGVDAQEYFQGQREVFEQSGQLAAQEMSSRPRMAGRSELRQSWWLRWLAGTSGTSSLSRCAATQRFGTSRSRWAVSGS
jgi:PDZ domain-containing secreted protein